ncbi:hypothetical protein C8F01DRAFT_45751 [Mycena amicta]|nr:hypothetical protein C8F01DRAFT_45751 [Mycena amicta]
MTPTSTLAITPLPLFLPLPPHPQSFCSYARLALTLLYSQLERPSGGSITAAQRLTGGGTDIAINWAGGLHHAIHPFPDARNAVHLHFLYHSRSSTSGSSFRHDDAGSPAVGMTTAGESAREWANILRGDPCG